MRAGWDKPFIYYIKIYWKLAFVKEKITYTVHPYHKSYFCLKQIQFGDVSANYLFIFNG